MAELSLALSNISVRHCYPLVGIVLAPDMIMTAESTSQQEADESSCVEH